MIIKLTGATFSNNLGTLESFFITRNIRGADYSIPAVVEKVSGQNYAVLEGTITMKEGYTFSSLVVTMGGQTINAATTTDNITWTISIPQVTADVEIIFKATGASTGEEDGGEDEPATPTSVLVSETGATLLTEMAMSTTSSTPTSNTTYYTYQFIPVIGGKTYRIAYGRRVWELGSNKEEIKTFAAHTDCTDYTFTVGATTAYISVTVKNTDIAASLLTLETIS